MIANLLWCMLVGVVSVFGSDGVGIDGRTIDARKLGRTFWGNNLKVANESFKLLVQEGDYLLFGARGVIYNISAASFKSSAYGSMDRHNDSNKAVQWQVPKNDVKGCMDANPKDKSDCFNFIRLLERGGPGEFIVCGTFAKKPKCRIYKKDPFYNDELVVTERFEGGGTCPDTPHYPSTALFDAATRELYAGTTISGQSATILLRSSLKRIDGDLSLRYYKTPTELPTLLNGASFVGSYDDESYVYFWFAEHTEWSYDNKLQGSKPKYVSRIARVCKNEWNSTRGYMLSFVKAVVTCSSSDSQFSIQISNIASITVVEDDDGNKTVFGIFNSPYDNSMGAVCAFKMNEIEQVFRNSKPFGYYPDTGTSMVPMRKAVDFNAKHSPKPGTCPDLTKQNPRYKHKYEGVDTLLFTPVDNFYEKPVFMNLNAQGSYTNILVDKVLGTNNKLYNVLFLSNDRGIIQKVVHITDFDSEHPKATKSHLIETIRVIEGEARIENMLIYRPSTKSIMEQLGSSPTLIVVSETSVKGISPSFCDEESVRSSCHQCIRLRDPYCAWDKIDKMCTSMPGRGPQWTPGQYFQDVENGDATVCGPNFVTLTAGTDNEPDAQPTSTAATCDCDNGDSVKLLESKMMHIGQTPTSTGLPLPQTERPVSTTASTNALIIGITVSACVSLIVGCLIGYFILARSHCGAKSSRPNSEASFEFPNKEPINNFYMSHGPSSRKGSGLIDAYTPSYRPSPEIDQEPVNIVLTSDDTPHASATSTLQRMTPKVTPADSVNFSMNTLPKDYKYCKKMYI